MKELKYSPMKIVYVANARIPTEKAHGIQIMKMCEAFAALGHTVELVVPWRFNAIQNDPFEYYAIERTFSIKKLFSLDMTALGRFGFLVQTVSFAVSVFFYTVFSKKEIIFGRDELVLLAASVWSNIVWETHTGRYTIATKMLLQRNVFVVAITESLRKFYLARGVASKKVYTIPDGVDLKLFDSALSREEARRELGLPVDAKIVVYTGHLYEWKGAHTLAEASRFLPSDTQLLFVGGTEQDTKRFTEQFGGLPNVQILGKKPYDRMPIYMKAADVLVLPNSATTDTSRLYTSPLKLFEYMASGRVIVASDLPSIREVLNEQNAVLVPPDDPKRLAGGIKRVLIEIDLRERLQGASYADSKQYTWEKRAEKIMSFIV